MHAGRPLAIVKSRRNCHLSWRLFNTLPLALVGNWLQMNTPNSLHLDVVLVSMTLDCDEISGRIQHHSGCIRQFARF